jgi:diaminopimelate epimerase
MKLKFTKMQGVGNDFVVIDGIGQEFTLSRELARRLADRHFGVGCDQILVVERPRQPGVDFRYRIWNADGGEVEQCGNGARCIARLVASRVGRRDRAYTMDSPGGLVQARLRGDGLVSVAMGVPNFDPRSLPLVADAETPSYHIDLPTGPVEFGAVSIGNPHAVIRVRTVADAPVDTVGPAMENHPRFAQRVNVGFLEIVTPDHVRLRVFERGVGETQACGTGACAAVAVGRRHGPLAEEVRVDLPGGRLIVRWPGPGEPIWLTGPAETAFEGQVDIVDEGRKEQTA